MIQLGVENEEGGTEIGERASEGAIKEVERCGGRIMREKEEDQRGKEREGEGGGEGKRRVRNKKETIKEAEGLLGRAVRGVRGLEGG